MPYYRQPTTDEAQSLRELQDYVELERHPGWKKVLAYADALVDETRIQYEGIISSDPMLSHTLRLRVAERKATVASIKQLIAKAVSERLSLLESMEIPEETPANVYDTDDSDSSIQ
jgi:hypothetical protein